MSDTYVVTALQYGELYVCELYEELQPALGRASALAHFTAVQHPEWVNNPPEHSIDSDGTQQWVFVDTSKHVVVVYLKKVHEAKTTKAVDPLDPLKSFSSSDKPNVLTSTTVPNTVAAPLLPLIVLQPPPAPILPKDDPMDRSLPGGWTYSGQAITMGKLLDDPYNVNPFYSLRDDQKYALVLSRVSKRPGFSVFVPGFGVCDQTAALNALKNKTNLGEEIVLMEIDWLDRMLDELNRHEDEESSSSSEEDF